MQRVADRHDRLRTSNSRQDTVGPVQTLSDYP